MLSCRRRSRAPSASVAISPNTSPCWARVGIRFCDLALNDAILITKDADFSDQALLGRPSPVVVWVRAGNLTRSQLLDWFDPLLDRVIGMIDAGERLIELQ